MFKVTKKDKAVAKALTAEAKAQEELDAAILASNDAYRIYRQENTRENIARNKLTAAQNLRMAVEKAGIFGLILG